MLSDPHRLSLKKLTHLLIRKFTTRGSEALYRSCSADSDALYRSCSADSDAKDQAAPSSSFFLLPPALLTIPKREKDIFARLFVRPACDSAGRGEGECELSEHKHYSQCPR